jgi:serine/threonine protein kinase
MQKDITDNEILSVEDFLDNIDPDLLEIKQFCDLDSPKAMEDKALSKFELNLKKAIEEMRESDFTLEVQGPELPVGKADVMAILQWLVDNMHKLELLSADNPLRFQANSDHYPLPITIHLIREDSGITLILDPNSKSPRLSLDQPMEKYPETKGAEKARKIIGVGGQKIVRYVWSFADEDNAFTACAANIYKGRSMVSQFEEVKTVIYQQNNPFLVPMKFGAKYEGHTSRDRGLPKAISFAGLADGSWDDLMKNLEKFSPDLGDILWIYYAAVSALAEFHASGMVHRDVKPDNFLFFRTAHGIHLCLNDFDQAMPQTLAEFSEEILCFPYYAFDAPFFAAVIQIQNVLLQGNIPQKFLGSTKSPKEQVREKCLEDFSEYKESINLILDSKHSLTVNTANHPKSDIWALCKILKVFGEKIRLYFPSVPPILTALDDLVDQNFRAGSQERMDGREFLLAIRKLYINLFAEKDLIACRDKVNNQLDQLRTLTSLSLFSLDKLDSLDHDEKPEPGKKQPTQDLEEKSSSPGPLTLSPPLSRNSQGSFAVNARNNPDLSTSQMVIPRDFC